MATRSGKGAPDPLGDSHPTVDFDAPFIERDTRRYESPSVHDGMATVSHVRAQHLVRVTGDRGAVGDDTVASSDSAQIEQILPGPGDVIDGQFEIVRAIGRGGMGHVYLGRDLDLGRQVAIKIMRLQSAGARHGDKMLELFKREARATAQLNHPNVVTIHQVGQWRGKPYLVLELLRGESLASRLQDGALGVPAALRVLSEVCRGLDHAHKAGLVHRDLKPGNIFLTQDGVAKVLDFGLAQLEPRHIAPASKVSGAMRISTRNSSVAGSPAYMAPEQWRREHTDARTDVWACGVVLYQLLTGALPFSSPRAVVSGPQPPRIDVLRPDVPAGVAAIVDRCLRRARGERFESAAALLDVLAAELAHVERSSDIRGDPYRYLESFTEADAGWFFGRKREVKRLALMLEKRPVIAVVGASGAGKTSLLRAGLLPQLRAGNDNWDVLALTPGRRPFDALVDRVESVCAGCAAAVKRGGALTTSHPGRIGQLLRRHARHTDSTCLIIVDQFEELFTQGADDEQRRAFATAILSAADDVHAPVRLIVSMREDFLTRLIEAPDLRDAVAGNMLPLGVPDEASLREAVCAPARRFGYNFEPTVIESILADVRTEPAPLPMVQFAVSQLWERRDLDNRRIGQELLDEVGGVAGVLATHAESLFHGLSAQTEVPIARAMLLELVTEHGTKRRVAREKLLQTAPDRDAAEGLLGVLVRGRLLTSLKEGDVEFVQLAHESLITRWTRLRGWLRKDEDARRFRDGVREAAERWHTNDCQPGLLWTGAMHDAAAQWRQRWPGRLTDVELAFLDAADSTSARTRQLKMALVIGAISVALLVALGSTFAMFEYRGQSAHAHRAESVARRAESQARKLANAADMARSQAQKSADDARAARARAVSKVVAAYATVTIAKDPLLAMLLAREAVAAGATAEALTALHRTLRASRQRRLVRGDTAGSLRATWLGFGDRFATWGDEGPAKLWSMASSKGVSLERAGDDVAEIVPCARGQRMAVRHGKGGATLLDLSGAEIAQLPTPKARLRALVYSPDGRALAGAADDGKVYSWHGSTGALLGTAGGARARSTLAWRSDSARFVVGDDGGGVEWITAEGASEHRGDGHHGATSAVAFLPDGRVISGGQDALVMLWRDGKRLATWRGHNGWITAIAVDATGEQVASASYDETARLWNVEKGEYRVLRAHDYIVSSVAFSPIDGRVLTTSFDGTAATWRPDGTLETRYSGHERPILGGSWSADGAHLLTFSEDGTARVWRSRDEEVFAAPATECELGQVVASPVGNRLLTLPDIDATRDCEHGKARLWRVGDHRPITLPRMQSAPPAEAAAPSAGAFSPDGRHVAVGDEAGRAVLWTSAGTRKAVLHGHRGAIRAIAFGRAGTYLYTASHDGTARKWSRDGIMQAVFAGHGASIGTLEVCAPNVVVTGSADGNGRIWRGDGSAIAWLPGHDGAVEQVSCDGAGKRIATLGSDGALRIWRLDGSRIAEVQADLQRLRLVTWLADGRIAAATAAGQVHLFDRRGVDLSVLDVSGPLTTLQAHPTKPLLLAGGRSGHASIWHTDGRRHSTLDGGKSPVLAASWLGDGRRAAVATRDAGLHVAQTDAAGLLDTARARSVRELSVDEQRRYGLSAPTR